MTPTIIDLVARLNAPRTETRYHGDHEISQDFPASALCREAASALQGLQEENERLFAVLMTIAHRRVHGDSVLNRLNLEHSIKEANAAICRATREGGE